MLPARLWDRSFSPWPPRPLPLQGSLGEMSSAKTRSEEAYEGSQVGRVPRAGSQAAGRLLGQCWLVPPPLPQPVHTHVPTQRDRMPCCPADPARNGRTCSACYLASLPRPLPYEVLLKAASLLPPLPCPQAALESMRRKLETYKRENKNLLASYDSWLKGVVAQRQPVVGASP